MDEQEVCAGTPVGCRAALGFVEKQLWRRALLLVLEGVAQTARNDRPGPRSAT
jgi:hypothetical protein